MYNVATKSTHPVPQVSNVQRFELGLSVGVSARTVYECTSHKRIICIARCSRSSILFQELNEYLLRILVTLGTSFSSMQDASMSSRYSCKSRLVMKKLVLVLHVRLVKCEGL